MEIKIELPQGKLTEVNASKFGLSETNADNAAAFADALAYCSDKSSLRLMVGPGIYYFRSDITAVLSGAKDIVIDGQNAEFIYSAKPPAGFMIFEDCERVEFKNLVVDWDWSRERLATVARVIGTDIENKTIEFEFPELSEVSPDMRWLNLNQCDPETYTAGTEDGKEYWPGALVFESVEKIAANALRITHNGSLDKVETGETYLIRHFTYGHDVLTLLRSSNMTVCGITVYGTPGMAFKVLEETHHYHFHHCKVGTRPGTNRHIAATADAMHVGNTKGYGIVEHCNFGFCGDDTLNIHDNNGIIARKESETVCLVRKTLSCMAGDTIFFRYPDFKPADFTAGILSVTEQDGLHKITFDRPLPEDIREDAILSNTKFNSDNIIIRNNYFHETRARGLLIQSGNTVVENNRFYKTQGAAILVVVDIYEAWSEGIGVDKLIVRNNVFDSCNVNNWTALIGICASTKTGITSYPAFTKLLFENNEFVDFPSEAFVICSAEDVTIRNNSFQNPTPRKHELDSRGTICIEKSQKINVFGNIWYKSDFVKNPVKVTVKEQEKQHELTLKDNIIRA